METKLIRYIKDVATLECQLYTQNKLKNNLEWQINRLGKERYYDEPILQKPDWDKSMSLFIAVLSFIVGFVIFFTLFVIVEIVPAKIIQNLPEFWKCLLLLSPIPIGFFTVYMPWYVINERKERKYQKFRYEKAIYEYNIAIANDNERVKREILVKKDMQKQLFNLKKSIGTTKSAINALYSINIIHPKYRDMVAVCSFYDYFDTGRCNAFTGPGGAYDTYETDLRFNRIENKLDVIISKLDEIIANQQYLGMLIRESNNALYRIEQQNKALLNSSNEIKENTELIEYNTRCSAQSSAVMEHLMVYNTLRSR